MCLTSDCIQSPHAYINLYQQDSFHVYTLVDTDPKCSNTNALDLTTSPSVCPSVLLYIATTIAARLGRVTKITSGDHRCAFIHLFIHPSIDRPKPRCEEQLDGPITERRDAHSISIYQSGLRRLGEIEHSTHVYIYTQIKLKFLIYAIRRRPTSQTKSRFSVSESLSVLFPLDTL